MWHASIECVGGGVTRLSMTRVGMSAPRGAGQRAGPLSSEAIRVRIRIAAHIASPGA